MWRPNSEPRSKFCDAGARRGDGQSQSGQSGQSGKAGDDDGDRDGGALMHDAGDYVIRDYTDSDESSWLRFRVLSFLATAYDDSSR